MIPYYYTIITITTLSYYNDHTILLYLHGLPEMLMAISENKNIPAIIYLFKFVNLNSRNRCE